MGEYAQSVIVGFAQRKILIFVHNLSKIEEILRFLILVHLQHFESYFFDKFVKI